MAELGFFTLAFDPSYTGESGGMPRYVASPDINTKDFCAAVDFLSVHCVAAYAQHRARLVGAEYRIGRCDEPHLAPASALGHGRPRAPFVSRLPRVPGHGRLPGRSPPSFPAAPRLDVGVHGRPRHQELPAAPVRVDLSRPDEVVCLVSARPHVLLNLDYRHPFAAILVALGRGAFGCACHVSSNLPVRHRARTPRDTVCLFVCATIEPPDGAWRA